MITNRTCQLVLIFVLLYFLCYCVVDEAHVSAPAQTLSRVSSVQCQPPEPIIEDRAGPSHSSRGLAVLCTLSEPGSEGYMAV